jgi:NADPH:quinone reductase-like Zn-dependent oxidoreductase
MKANRIHRFGLPEVIKLEEADRPLPGEGEVLIRVKASGVGPWDGRIREGKKCLASTLASDARPGPFWHHRVSRHRRHRLQGW